MCFANTCARINTPVLSSMHCIRDDDGGGNGGGDDVGSDDLRLFF